MVGISNKWRPTLTCFQKIDIILWTIWQKIKLTYTINWMLDTIKVYYCQIFAKPTFFCHNAFNLAKYVLILVVKAGFPKKLVYQQKRKYLFFLFQFKNCLEMIPMRNAGSARNALGWWIERSINNLRSRFYSHGKKLPRVKKSQ